MRSIALWRALAVGAALFAGAVAAHAETLVFTPLQSHYAAGDTVGWTVTPAPGAPSLPGTYSYRITKDETAVVKTGSFDMKAGKATIEMPSEGPASYRVIVDYLAPPPPPPPPPEVLKQENAAVRALLLKTDPTLKDILDKYPDYAFIHPTFDLTRFNEDRIATLDATVAPQRP